MQHKRPGGLCGFKARPSARTSADASLLCFFSGTGDKICHFGGRDMPLLSPNPQQTQAFTVTLTTSPPNDPPPSPYSFQLLGICPVRTLYCSVFGACIRPVLHVLGFGVPVAPARMVGFWWVSEARGTSEARDGRSVFLVSDSLLFSLLSETSEAERSARQLMRPGGTARRGVS